MILLNGALYRKWEDVVPSHNPSDLIKMLHDSSTSGHFRNRKTFYRFYWPGQAKQIEEYIKRCTSCVTAKPPWFYNLAPLKPIVTLPADIIFGRPDNCPSFELEYSDYVLELKARLEEMYEYVRGRHSVKVELIYDLNVRLIE